VTRLPHTGEQIFHTNQWMLSAGLEAQTWNTSGMIAAQTVLSSYRGGDRELVFAVVHLSEMLVAFKANYCAAWRGEQQLDTP
jgi:hypothetical protein